MLKIDERIYVLDKTIEKNIQLYSDENKGLIFQNILAQLRNLVEALAVKIYLTGRDEDIDYKRIKSAISYLKSRGDLKHLRDFHDMLKISVSHYTLDEDNSERLMIKYYEKMLLIKNYMLEKYGMKLLSNLDIIEPVFEDNEEKYYRKIVESINSKTDENISSSKRHKYYVYKTNTFVIDKKVYYEHTIGLALDNSSKFNRIIVFTDIDIMSNYAVSLTTVEKKIHVNNQDITVNIIRDWNVDIRDCEFTNFLKIFEIKNYNASVNEIKNLKTFLTEKKINLLDIVRLDDNYFNEFEKQIIINTSSRHFLETLKYIREMITSKLPGYNTISYLLFIFRNTIIKNQYSNDWDYYLNGYVSKKNEKLSSLYLSYKCIPFENMPLCTSLVGHNPRIYDLLHCIDYSDRQHELLARKIENNTKLNGILYTCRSELQEIKEIDKKIRLYNNALYKTHIESRKIVSENGFYYINGYEKNLIEIINEITSYTSGGLLNYSNNVKSKILKNEIILDCCDKEKILTSMFSNSKISILQGAAGTGKTKIIEYVSQIFSESSILYLTETHPALNNLKRRINTGDFKTITSYLSSRKTISYDLIIIDECSTVPNENILKILNKSNFNLMLLIGDVFQIESIKYGSWFNKISQFVPNHVVNELTKTFRTTNQGLLTLWGRVRNKNNSIIETLTKNNYVQDIDEKIFEVFSEDEILLSLNYNGLYGVNNLNKVFQDTNPSKEYLVGVNTFKINDPVIFNDSERFSPLLYNNLKGKIVGINQYSKNRYFFDILINHVYRPIELSDYNLELVESNDFSSVIRFELVDDNNPDIEIKKNDNSVIPIQVSYAVSIHKSQGLEYDSVKIIIPDEIDEKVSFNIFYTAITRAKSKLKIFWSSKSEFKIINRIENEKDKYTKDIMILNEKLSK